jgi:hypothetical protein
MAIANSIRKYGKDNFTIEAIYIANSIDELNEKEKQYIAEFDSLRPNGYNLTTGGLNYIRSEETKKKMSIHQIGEGNHLFGKKHSEESKKKMSIARMGEKNHMFGKRMKEGHSQKMLAAQKGMRHPRLGKTFSEESKKKMSNAQKGRPSKRRMPVKCNETNQIYPSLTEAARAFSIWPGYLCQHLKGNAKHCKGYTFSYV